jgi:hypothetical protein
VSVLIKGDEIRAIALGVYTAKTGMTILNASTSAFTVTGLVKVTGLVGLVTTVIGGAVNLNLTHTPSGGAAADLCAATVCDNDAAGTLYGITGVATDLMSAQTVTGVEVPRTQAVGSFTQGGLVLPAGSLKFKGSAAQTGAVAWYLTYVPITPGASVVAA